MNRSALKILAVFLAGTSLAGLTSASGLKAQYERTGRVKESGLAAIVPSPHIYAFDLSPSGEVLALLVRSGEHLNSFATWLLIVNARTAEVMRKVETASTATFWSLSAYYPPQVIFAADEKYLVIQEQGHVNVVDAATLRTISTVQPPASGPRIPISITGSAGKDLFAVSFGTGQSPSVQGQKIPVHVEIIDVSDEVHHGSWDSDDIVQALSPDARLAAASAHDAGGSLLKISVVDAASGKRVALLDGGFGFPDPQPGRVIGRIVGRFLNDQHLVLSPDGSVDRSGHHSGTGLKIVDISDGRIVQSLEPPRFAATGDLAVSGDSRTILAASWYLTPSFYTRSHQRPPAGSTPELIAFSGTRDIQVDGIVTSVHGGLDTGGAVVAFRIASDGSAVVVAEDSGITLFRRR